MRIKVLFITLVSVLLLMVLLPYTAFLRSYAIMSAYSGIHRQSSVIKKNNITFDIPGGSFTREKDWYPFINTFNDNEGLSWFLGKRVEFTVLYNFGHFEIMKGCSSYYNPESPYYSSFYGGYIIKPVNEKERFGFLEDGTLNTDELARVPEYDQIYLVLSSLGCPYDKGVFDTNITSMEYGITYAGYDDWVKTESEIITNSPLHTFEKYKRGYIQFGNPRYGYDTRENFPLTELKGRVYVRYFEECNATFFLYILAPAWETIDNCDNNILRHTVIDFSN